MTALAAMTLSVATPVFAEGSCSCDKKCVEECKKGKNEHCPCEDCACAKGHKCKHGKCGKKHAHNHDDKHEDKLDTKHEDKHDQK
jgi:hypothetical protein